MKIITTLLMLALLTVSGCGTTTERKRYAAPTEFYRFPGETAQAVINGVLHERTDSNGFTYTRRKMLALSINGDEALEVMLDDNWAGEGRGEWQGKRISGLCRSVKQLQQRATNHIIQYAYSYDVDCAIIIDGEQTVTLTF